MGNKPQIPSDQIDFKDGQLSAEKFDSDVNQSLDKADSATQPGDNLSSLNNDLSFTSNLGTVTSVAISTSDGLEVNSGSPITESGTILLGVNKAGMLIHLNIEDGAEVNDTGAEIALKLFSEDNINEFTDAEKSKLATVESSKWLGEYASLTALNAAHPSPNPPGSYANVDGGPGADVKRYLWDVTDDAFVIQEGTASNLTSADIKSLYEDNADTEAFTTAEKNKLASITAIFTSTLKTAYDNAVTWISTNGTNLLNHLTNISNPHYVTKSQVGLSLVPNLDTTNAVNNEHTHSNKNVLDNITEAFTTALKNDYDGAVTDKHTHTNKNVLDNITEAFTTALKNDYDGAVTDKHTHANKPILDNIENLLNATAKLETANKFTQQQIIEGSLSIPLVLSNPAYKAWVLHRPGGAGGEGALIFAPNMAVGNYVDGNNVDWAKQIKFDEGYVTAIGFKTTTAATGFLKANGTVDDTVYATVSDANSVAIQVVEANRGVIDIVGLSTNTVLTDALRGKVGSINSATNVTITVNQNSLTNIGDVAYIDQTGVGTITVTPGTGTINLRKNANVQLITDGQYSRVAIHKVSSTDYRVFGELKPV
jgi:hypothetical protein